MIAKYTQCDLLQSMALCTRHHNFTFAVFGALVSGLPVLTVRPEAFLVLIGPLLWLARNVLLSDERRNDGHPGKTHESATWTAQEKKVR